MFTSVLIESGADIYLAALRFGKYPALATSSSVKSCYLFIIYRDITLLQKKDIRPVFPEKNISDSNSFQTLKTTSTSFLWV